MSSRLLRNARTRSVSVAALLAVAIIGVAGPAFAAPPGNDNFATPLVVSGAAGTTPSSNIDATTEQDEPGHPEGPFASVWFEWEAPANGTVTFDTCGSDFDTMMAAYEGSTLASLDQLEANDDAASSGCTFQSRVSFGVTDGTTYRVAVDGVAGATGAITLNWNFGVAPPNDDFANAQAISGAFGTATGTNENATTEPGEPTEFESESTVWYRWTSPMTGTAEFQTCASDFDTVLLAAEGVAVDELEVLALNDDTEACGSGSIVRVPVSAGDEYSISVGGFFDHTGSIALKWGTVPRRVDTKIKRNADAVFVGDDEYSQGEDPFGFFDAPFLATKVKAGKSVKLDLVFENEGSVLDSFDVSVFCDRSRGVKIKFLAGAVDVTQQVFEGSYDTGDLASGAEHALVVKVSASSTARRGGAFCFIEGASFGAGPDPRDSVFLEAFVP
jgi:hypothetical protein